MTRRDVVPLVQAYRRARRTKKAAYRAFDAACDSGADQTTINQLDGELAQALSACVRAEDSWLLAKSQVPDTMLP